MAELHSDVLEEIMKRLDMSNLIKCKSVCKSWKTFISSTSFVNFHMNLNYHLDCNESYIDRRIVMGRIASPYESRHYEFDDRFFDHRDCHLFGSSLGLVCISPSPSEILVANPATREAQRIKEHDITDAKLLCWGFGYDSFADDFKVVIGFTKGDGLTCFQVLALKSNEWKVIGDVNYSIDSRIGILCNGALHWVMKKNNKKVILSFCLSEEEFKEIPQPDNEEYESESTNASLPTMRLGVLDECLCVFHYDKVIDKIWMMTSYNVKQSWGIVGKDCERRVVLHSLKTLKHYIRYKKSWYRDIFLFRNRDFIGAPIYVETLVSPYVNGSPMKKRHLGDIKKHCKLLKGDPSVAGPSSRV
ncbi:hypothetical protein Lser_V15G29452 [Lactuca serriola]